LDDRSSTAGRAYAEIRQRILAFRLRPGARVNEVALAEQLGLSRTPLREALNRLVAEGMLAAGERGFAVPELDPALIRDLMEARIELECSIVRLAAARAGDAALAALDDFLAGSAAESPDASVDRLLELDRRFHEGIALLSGNAEMLRILRNLNDRIQLIRWIAMEGRRGITQQEHRAILDCLSRRDAAGAEALMRAHILHRHDEILAAVKQAYAHVHTAPFAPTP
jgi:DNA-binding GntR family transcriptional regulator